MADYVSPWSDEELEGIAREHIPGFDDLAVEAMGRVLQGIRIGARNPDPSVVESREPFPSDEAAWDREDFVQTIREQLAKGSYQTPGELLPYEDNARAIGCRHCRAVPPCCPRCRLLPP